MDEKTAKLFLEKLDTQNEILKTIADRMRRLDNDLDDLEKAILKLAGRR